MPKSKRTKKRQNRVTKVSRGVPTVPNTGLGFPQNKTVKMRYVTEPGTIINAGAGGLASITFRANSINDPDQSGAGHQPYGHDQWAGFYDHYTVLKSTINVYYTVDITQNNGPQVVGINLNDDNSFLPTSLDHACELPGSVFTILPAAEQITKKLSMTYDAKKYFNRKDPAGDDDLRAAFGSNPGDPVTFHLFAGSMDGFTNAQIVDVWATIDYQISLSEPRELAQS